MIMLTVVSLLAIVLYLVCCAAVARGIISGQHRNEVMHDLNDLINVETGFDW